MGNRSNINLVGNTTQGQNVGVGVGVYAGKDLGNTLQFKELSVTGTTMVITSDDENIYFSANNGGGGGTITGATNGLSTSGADIVLGGELTGITNITIISGTSLTITDSRTGTTGIQYADDYSDDFGLNSLSDYRSVVATVPVLKILDFTLSLDELGKVIIATRGSELLITIPKDSTTDFPIGSLISVQQGGIGLVTAVPEDGTVIVSGFSLSTTQKYGFVQYWKTAANTWSIIGGPIESWQVTGGTVLVPVSTFQKVCANAVFYPGSYVWASVPSASSHDGGNVYVSDCKWMVWSNGSNWLHFSGGTAI